MSIVIWPLLYFSEFFPQPLDHFLMATFFPFSITKSHSRFNQHRQASQKPQMVTVIRLPPHLMVGHQSNKTLFIFYDFLLLTFFSSSRSITILMMFFTLSCFLWRFQFLGVKFCASIWYTTTNTICGDTLSSVISFDKKKWIKNHFYYFFHRFRT